MTGILLVDKEQDWTSSDVVSKLRGVLHERRIGHAGTLDPLATGLLIVLLGRATRASDYAMAHCKEYVALMRTGLITDTQDITGTAIGGNPRDISTGELNAALKKFTGNISQIPPMYSAIKVSGKKLYEIARSGREVERSSRNITVDSIEYLGKSGEDFKLRIKCSAGTYIRTLCHDIGTELGCGACMSGLRRTSIGNYSVNNAHTIAQIEEAMNSGRIDEMIIPVDSLFADCPAYYASLVEEKKIRNGNSFPLEANDGLLRVYSPSEEFLMLGRVRNNTLFTEKSFFEPLRIQ